MQDSTTIIKVKDETHDVKTFRLDKKIDFIPCQYCLVSFPDDEDEKKPFTFSNSPTDDFTELTVKKMGNFTTKLHQLKEGDRLSLTEPKGEALNFDESVKDDVVFIAGGSGITPFMSALRYAVAKKLKNDIILLFSNRTKNDIIYREELEEINKLSNITVINTLSDQIPEDWHGEKGRIDKDMIEKYVDNPKEKLWYVCAPPPMVKAMKAILEDMNIPKDNWRIEDWEIAGKHDKVD